MSGFPNDTNLPCDVAAVSEDTALHNTVAPELFREALSRVGAAVHVVTTAGPAGKAGFTATAICSVSDMPATLLVCVNRRSQIMRLLEENLRLCVNTLDAGDQTIADVFAGRTGQFMEARFETGAWLTLPSGSPALESAIVSFDCAITEIKRVATHDIVFAAVKEVRASARGRALLYHERIYKSM